MISRGVSKRCLVGALVLAGLYLLFMLALDTSRYRFRMTVEVATPHGLKSGSSVMEVEVSRELLRFGDMGPGSGGLKGEAVAVDLPDGPLFVLPKQKDAGQNLLDENATAALIGHGREAVIASRGKVTLFEDFMASVKQLGQRQSVGHTAELPRADWPMMVRFRDVHDVKSVEEVVPETVGVQRIVLQVTREPVSEELAKRLKLLGIEKGHGLDDSHSVSGDLTLAQELGYRDFRKGFSHNE